METEPISEPPKTEPQTIDEALLAARAMRRLTRSNAAKQAGIARTTWAAWERGELPVKVRDLVSIAAWLGLPPVRVFELWLAQARRAEDA